ncbi:hypothetical protein RJ641_033758 [Dillenia turbinata]|uniref:DUF7722 domain-containing protein n=1 Tax=Dillenia turbinata TaxID=194707 RepID=A0AAN8VKE5_9MAGN
MNRAEFGILAAYHALQRIYILFTPSCLQYREREREMESVSGPAPNGNHARERCGYFQMPLHYRRYTKSDYESTPEWKLDCLLSRVWSPSDWKC